MPNSKKYLSNKHSIKEQNSLCTAPCANVLSSESLGNKPQLLSIKFCIGWIHNGERKNCTIAPNNQSSGVSLLIFCALAKTTEKIRCTKRWRFLKHWQHFMVKYNFCLICIEIWLWITLLSVVINGLIHLFVSLLSFRVFKCSIRSLLIPILSLAIGVTYALVQVTAFGKS